MANVQTQIIINRNASPEVFNVPPGGEMPDVVVVIAQYVAVAGVATNDTVEICRIPVVARILSIERMNTSIATTGTTDIGLAVPGISPAFTGGGLQTALCTGSAWGTAVAFWTNIMGTGSTPTVANMGKMAWELAGASSDPSLLATGAFLEYVIVAKHTSIATPTGGNVALKIAYQVR